MSLINEALKKAERTHNPTQTNIPRAVMPASPKCEGSSKKNNYIMPILIAMISAVGAAGMTLHLTGKHLLPSPRAAIAKLINNEHTNDGRAKPLQNRTVLIAQDDAAIKTPKTIQISKTPAPNPNIQPKYSSIIPLEPIGYIENIEKIESKPVAKIKPKTKPKPKIAPTPKLPKLILSGIIFHYDETKAVINNTAYAAGDIVDGAKIIKIESARVILLFKGKHFTINL